MAQGDDESGIDCECVAQGRPCMQADHHHHNLSYRSSFRHLPRYLLTLFCAFSRML